MMRAIAFAICLLLATPAVADKDDVKRSDLQKRLDKAIEIKALEIEAILEKEGIEFFKREQRPCKIEAAHEAIYKAAVIYNFFERGPEHCQVFGRFKSLEACLAHATARVTAIVKRSGGLGVQGYPEGAVWDANIYCLYFEKKGAKPVLLK